MVGSIRRIFFKESRYPTSVDNKTLRVDLALLREVEKAWKEIANGKAGKASRKRFLEELQTW
jgi:hypothetical protein